METGDYKGVYWKKKMKESEPSVRHYMGTRFETDKLLHVVENGMQYLVHILLFIWFIIHFYSYHSIASPLLMTSMLTIYF